MVLSNKKLKQKLRTSMVESLTASEEVQNHQSNHDSQTHHHSLKSLVDSAIQKPRLSKRDKRRKTAPVSELGPEIVGLSNTGDTQKDNEKVESESANEKGKSKKRKRKDESESVVAESVENDEAKVAKKSKKKKKKKKKKVKKEVKEEMKNGVEGTNGVSEEQGVTETIKTTTDSEEKGDLATKVYVGGIPFYSTEDDIRSYFDSCGTITEVDCMKFSESGKFRGIAMITFKTEAAAKRALALDGADMGGLFLKILPFKSTKTKKESDFAPAIVEGYNKIYVGNLSWDITEDELRKLFSDCSITSIKFGEDKETGEFRGYAHVDFSNSLSLTMALKLDQKIVCGRPVRIRCAVPRRVPETNSDRMPESKKDDKSDRMPESKKDDKSDPMPESKKDDNIEASSVSGKIRRRTCYECGEKGHLSSSCPKIQAADATNSSKKDDNIEASSVSGKIRRQTCYECGEKGHLSSSCPKIQAADATNSSKKDDNMEASSVSGKIRRRTCYECGEKGHLSSSCPKIQAADATNSMLS